MILGNEDRRKMEEGEERKKRDMTVTKKVAIEIESIRRKMEEGRRDMMAANIVIMEKVDIRKMEEGRRDVTATVMRVIMEIVELRDIGNQREKDTQS